MTGASSITYVQDATTNEEGYIIMELNPKLSEIMIRENNNRTFGIHTYFVDFFNNLVNQEDQLDILQEECAELIQACSKVLRDKPNALPNLKEEMTHVLISSAMVARIFNITQEDIDLEIKRKLDKFYAVGFVPERKIDRGVLFEKYKERARCAYEAK